MNVSTFDSTFKVGDVIVRGDYSVLTVRITEMRPGQGSFLCDKLNENGDVTHRNESREKSSMGEWRLKTPTASDRVPIGYMARGGLDFEQSYRVGDTIKRGGDTVVISDLGLGSRNFGSTNKNAKGYTRWHKYESGSWTLVAYADPTRYDVGDWVSRPSWVRNGYKPVQVTAIGDDLILGIRDGETEEKSWYKSKGGETLTKFEKPVGPQQAFKFVSKEGKTRNGSYQWPMPTDGKPVVVECDRSHIVPGNHVCPDRVGDGVMAATTIQAAESGGHSLRDSVGLWLEYNPEDVLGSGGGKVRLRKVTVTGVFDPYVQQAKSDSRFQQLLQGLL